MSLIPSIPIRQTLNIDLNQFQQHTTSIEALEEAIKLITTVMYIEKTPNSGLEYVYTGTKQNLSFDVGNAH